MSTLFMFLLSNYMSKHKNQSTLKSLLASKETLESSVSFLKKSPKIDIDQLSDQSLEYSMIQWLPQWFSISPEKLHQYKSVHYYCAICGQLVEEIEKAKGCKYKTNQNLYLSHKKCIQKQPNDVHFNNTELIDTQILFENNQKKIRNVAIGQKQFLLTISVYHPLSSFMYFKLHRKLVFNGKSIVWDFLQQSKTGNMAEPNIICIPISEFKLEVQLQELYTSKNEKKNFIYLVNLSKVSFNTIFIEGQGKQIDLKAQFQILHTMSQKKTIIDEMNFKYRYNVVEKQPIIRFKKIEIEVSSPISVYDYGSIQQEQIQDLEIEAIDSIDWGSANSFRKTQWNVGSSQELYESQKQLISSEITLIKSQTQLPTYIQTSHLKDDICTLSGSKQMQKNIQFMVPQEIDSVIDQLFNYFPQIIGNEYGNYMFQSLLNVCSFQQRLAILGTLCDDMKQLVCSQQGTFSFQQYLNFITSIQQVEMIYSSLVGQYREISKDRYGTHFLRKMIKSFPFHYGVKITEELLDFIVQLALDKNAVCVLKVLLSTLGNHEPYCLKIRQLFIQIIHKNLDKIIADQFGNYLIQQCFDLFPKQNLYELNQQLIKKFKEYSMGNFSNNVIIKCIRCHWKNPLIYEQFDNKFQFEDVAAMFRKKESNKVLLEILEHETDFKFKIKIQNVIDKLQQAKFNKEKWQHSVRKSQTDNVGTKYKTFSDAVHAKPRKR